MEWTTPAIQSLQLRVATPVRIHLSFRSVRQPSYYIIETTPSDAESCEEQDGSKQKFLRRNSGQVIAQFVPGCNKKQRREMKMKDLNSAEESDFSCKLQ